MNIEEFREYCLAKKGITEEFPFDEFVLVFKVMGKMFALTSVVGEFSINLKCEPGLAIELREKYETITPGYHMNKKHWNTVKLDGHLPESEIQRMVDSSYELVIKGLPKKQRQGLVLKLAAD